MINLKGWFDIEIMGKKILKYIYIHECIIVQVSSELDFIQLLQNVREGNFF